MAVRTLAIAWWGLIKLLSITSLILISVLWFSLAPTVPWWPIVCLLVGPADGKVTFSTRRLHNLLMVEMVRKISVVSTVLIVHSNNTDMAVLTHIIQAQQNIKPLSI